jgi:hypothetical protein
MRVHSGYALSAGREGPLGMRYTKSAISWRSGRPRTSPRNGEAQRLSTGVDACRAQTRGGGTRPVAEPHPFRNRMSDISMIRIP